MKLWAFAMISTSPASRRRDGVTLALQAYTLAHDGTEMQAGNAGSSATMHASQIAAKHKNLVLF